MVKEAGLVAKAMDLLDILGREGSGSITGLAERAGLPVATAHRIVRTLVERDYILRVARARYTLGPAMLRLGAAVSVRQLLADLGRPLLQALSRQEKLHTYLGVFDDDMVTYLVKCTTGQHPFAPVEGTQLEAYCSGIGKALLAYLPEEQRQSYLQQGKFVALTPNTITSADLLEQELERVRASGWAADRDEIMPGLRCVAVPIFGASGKLCAAVSASGSTACMAEGILLDLARKLGGIARQIGERLPV